MFEVTELDLITLAEDMGVDLDTLGHLFNIYCLEMNGELEQLNVHLKSRSWEKLQRITHNIKGISANLYLHRMYKAAETLHLQLKDRHLEGIGEFVREIEDTFRITCSDIVNAFKKHNIIIQIK